MKSSSSVTTEWDFSLWSIFQRLPRKTTCNKKARAIMKERKKEGFSLSILSIASLPVVIVVESFVILVRLICIVFIKFRIIKQKCVHKLMNTESYFENFGFGCVSCVNSFPKCVWLNRNWKNVFLNAVCGLHICWKYVVCIRFFFVAQRTFLWQQ